MNKCVIMAAFLMCVEIAGAASNYGGYLVRTFKRADDGAIKGVIKGCTGVIVQTWGKNHGPLEIDLIVDARDSDPMEKKGLEAILGLAQDKGEIAENLTNQRNCAGSALGSILFGSALYARNICSNGVSSVVGAASAVALKSFLSRKAPNSAEDLVLAGGVGLVTYGYNKWIIGEPRGEETADNA